MGTTVYDTLAIDPELENRIRIKQATASVGTFGRFHQAGSPNEALTKLDSAEPVDVVFVSDRFGQSAVLDFVRAAKQKKSGQDSAYVFIVKTSDELKTLVAQNVLGGIDGFLCEPYSVDSLTEIAHLAARVKKERSEARETAAIRFLMTQISEQISVIAQLKALGIDSKRENKRLTDMCAVFNSLDDATRLRYHAIALEVFESAPMPKPLAVRAYGGASSRVKKKMEQKIVDQLATQDKGESTPV